MSAARTPEVIEIEAGRHWMVESRSVAPGAFWSVTYALEPYISVEGEARTRWEMRCPCPKGKAEVVYAIEARMPCAHMRAVVAHQDAKHRRPSAPINASTFVD